MRVHLVDGTFELFRCYFGAPSATAPDGREVGGTRGILRALLAMLRMEAMTHVAVAFDTVIESFRNDMFDGYKTGAGLPEDLLAQFPLAEAAAAALGLVVWPMIEFEADDAIASGVALAAADPRVEQVVMVSPDKDFAQCVSGQRVVALDRPRKRILDQDAVRARFGVEPESIPDYLALVGDTADGIPGLAGWGARSTATVLAHYRHLEAIPADPRLWAVTVRSSAALAAVLGARREDALLYCRLATLRVDAPLGIGSVDELVWRGADRVALEALCTSIGDLGFLGDVPRWRD